MNYEVDPVARKIFEKFERAAVLTSTWRERVNELTRMYLTDQWDDAELKYMKEKKRHPITINITAPIIDGHVAMLASNNPRYKAIPSTGRANLAARAADFIMEYICYHCHFSSEFVPCMRDYSIAGIGWMIADVDVLADFSFGEVENRYVPLTNVFWDWRAKRPGFSDMEWVQLFKWVTAGRLKAIYEKSAGRIDEAVQWDWNHIDGLRSLPSGAKAYGQTRVVLPADVQGYSGQYGDSWFTGDEKELPVIQEFKLVYKKMMFVSDPATSVQTIFTMDEWDEVKMDLDVRLIENAIEIVIPHVRRITTIADFAVLEDRELKLTKLPLVPFVRTGTGTSLPQGIAERLYDIQIDYNKRRIAIIDNAMSTATGRILAPENMINEADYYDKYRLAGALLTYKPNYSIEQNPIIQLQAQPLPNQFYYLEQTQVQMAEYVTGIDALIIGSSRDLPDTYRQSLMIEDYSRRRVKAIDMTSIDRGLEQLGQVTLELAQWWYTYDKELMILDDDGRMREFAIGRVDRAPDGRIRANLEDFRGTRFNVRVVTGSTMPTNKYALLELYMGLFDRGFPVEEQVLKNTDIIEYDEVMVKMDKLLQAQQLIQNAQETMKEQGQIIDRLKNQLVTAEIKDTSRELMMAEHLASLQRQMQERFARALIEMSAKDTVRELKSQAAIAEEVSRVKVQNVTELARRGLMAGGRKEQPKE